jgi:polyhydroxyalkanoate synthesis repressor PhaR
MVIGSQARTGIFRQRVGHTSEEPMSDPRVIKKYPNRRLYDTVESRYITLADVKRLVVERIDFVVVDKKSNSDITRSILLQVIAEQEHLPEPLLTHDFLIGVIRSYGSGVQGLVSSHLEQTLRQFLNQHLLPRERAKTSDGTDAPRPRTPEEGYKALSPARIRDTEMDRDESNLTK